MAKMIQINQKYLIVILVVLGLFLIGALVQYLSIPKPYDEKILKKQNPEEKYRNFGFNNSYEFNDQNSCRGRTDVDRSFQPLQYSFDQLPYFRKFPYFNYYNSPQVMGAGRRRIPIDTRQAIPNILDPIDISNRNIAPSTVSVSSELDMRLRKIGSAYKIFDNQNIVHGLYGRKIYRNRDDKWEYFLKVFPSGETLPVLTKRPNEELGNNDEIMVEGLCGKFRVSIYHGYIPQYIPFI